MRALFLCSLLAACGGSTEIDAGRDGTPDAGTDAGKTDAGLDAGTDAGSIAIDADVDAGAPCAAMDASEGTPCGPDEDPAIRYLFDGRDCRSVAWCDCTGADCGRLFDSLAACELAYDACIGAPCARDDECASGEEWCLDGHCRPCDNGGLACRIVCPEGWSTYVRNGCVPCECAPPNDCTSDAECPMGRACYAGAYCWCSPADPSCCQGNTCSLPGCTSENPVGCAVRGCPPGQECDRAMCGSSGCTCAGTTWSCLPDCSGGVCTGG